MVVTSEVIFKCDYILKKQALHPLENYRSVPYCKVVLFFALSLSSQTHARSLSLKNTEARLATCENLGRSFLYHLVAAYKLNKLKFMKFLYTYTWEYGNSM